MSGPDSEATRATARLGQVLRGKYRLDRVLGVGGMAAVYVATHRNGMEVAVKVLHPELTANAEVRGRFLREGLAANALKHPGAVKVLDDDVAEDGSAFLVMELLEGETLDAVWERCGRVLPLETVLVAGFQLCDLLAAAHAHGIVHRDIKPQNLFLTVGGQLKVLDFGIARLREAAASNGSKSDAGTGTATGMMLGTPAFMAPEQASGDTKRVGVKSDIYGAGATLFTVLSGVHVHEGENAQQVVVRAATTPARSLAAVLPDAPPSLVEIVDRALAFDPAARWPSAAAMRDALRDAHAALVGPMPLAIPLPKLTGLAWFRMARSVPVLASVSTAVPVAIAESAPGSGDGAPRSGPTSSVRGAGTVPAVSAPDARVRRRTVASVGAAVVTSVLVGAGVLLALRGHERQEAPTVTRAPSGSATAAAGSPAPASTVPAAVLAYRAGLQAEHDVNREVAEASFLSAAAADPGMGAAHLRYALSVFLFEHGAAAHSHFQKAVGLRSTMSPEDVALLDAFAPLFEKQPPDWAEAERRLEAATKRFPADSELLHQLAKVELQRNELEAAVATADAALALDPRFAGALDVKEIALQRQGDMPGVVRAADACLEVAPQAAGCLALRIDALSALGRCTDVERDARQMLAINPGGTYGFFSLAQAGLVEGRTAAGVLESLRMEWKNQGEQAAWAEASDRADLAALRGDTADLDRWLEAMGRIADQGRDGFQHMNVAWTRVEELTELGALDRAAAVASDFLERRDAWEQDPGVDVQGIAFDAVPMLSAAVLRGGKITQDELERRRDRWIEGWRQRLHPGMAGYLWVYGYAQTVSTPADARAALAVLPQFSPLPAYRPSFVADAGIGHTYLLGGQARDAIPVLQRATSRCDPFEDPFASVHASLWLGEALQLEGRKDEACVAYDHVVRAWGGMGSRSVTVREARAKAAALACPAGK